MKYVSIFIFVCFSFFTSAYASFEPNPAQKDIIINSYDPYFEDLAALLRERADIARILLYQVFHKNNDPTEAIGMSEKWIKRTSITQKNLEDISKVLVNLKKMHNEIFRYMIKVGDAPESQMEYTEYVNSLLPQLLWNGYTASDQFTGSQSDLRILVPIFFLAFSSSSGQNNSQSAQAMTDEISKFKRKWNIPNTPLECQHCTPANLSYLDLRGLQLPWIRSKHAQVDHANLEETDFSEGWLYGWNMNGARVKGADFSHSDIAIRAKEDWDVKDVLQANWNQASFSWNPPTWLPDLKKLQDDDDSASVSEVDQSNTANTNETEKRLQLKCTSLELQCTALELELKKLNQTNTMIQQQINILIQKATDEQAERRLREELYLDEQVRLNQQNKDKKRNKKERCLIQ